jgi:hypothetical protein
MDFSVFGERTFNNLRRKFLAETLRKRVFQQPQAMALKIALTGSMSSIKRDVKKKSSASAGVGICFSRSSPLYICLAGAVLPFHSHKLLLVP